MRLIEIANSHAERAAGYRMAGERALARAHEGVALEARHAHERLTAALERLEKAKPEPAKLVRIATRADGRPAHQRSV